MTRTKTVTSAVAIAAAFTTTLALLDLPLWVVLVILAAWSLTGVLLGLLVGRAIRIGQSQPTPPETTEEVSGDEH